jgi:hypothetical protein
MTLSVRISTIWGLGKIKRQIVLNTIGIEIRSSHVQELGIKLSKPSKATMDYVLSGPLIRRVGQNFGINVSFPLCVWNDRVVHNHFHSFSRRRTYTIPSSYSSSFLPLLTLVLCFFELKKQWEKDNHLN